MASKLDFKTFFPFTTQSYIWLSISLFDWQCKSISHSVTQFSLSVSESGMHEVAIFSFRAADCPWSVAPQFIATNVKKRVFFGLPWTLEFTRNHLKISYKFQKLSKSRLNNLFFGLFLVISEVGSQIYIANSAIFKIWVFSATFRHEIPLYAIDLDKKRFRTPFLIL